MRYEIRQDLGMWSVINADTGEIARVNDTWLEGMTMEDADDMADLLNRIEAKRPPADS